MPIANLKKRQGNTHQPNLGKQQMSPPNGNIKMTPINPVVSMPSPPAINPSFILGTSQKVGKISVQVAKTKMKNVCWNALNQ